MHQHAPISNSKNDLLEKKAEEKKAAGEIKAKEREPMAEKMGGEKKDAEDVMAKEKEVSAAQKATEKNDLAAKKG